MEKLVPQIGDIIVDYSWFNFQILKRNVGKVFKIRPASGPGSREDYDFLYGDSFVGFNRYFSCFHTDQSGVRYWAPAAFDTNPATTQVVHGKWTKKLEENALQQFAADCK